MKIIVYIYKDITKTNSFNLIINIFEQGSRENIRWNRLQIFRIIPFAPVAVGNRVIGRHGNLLPVALHDRHPSTDVTIMGGGGIFGGNFFEEVVYGDGGFQPGALAVVAMVIVGKYGDHVEVVLVLGIFGFEQVPPSHHLLARLRTHQVLFCGENIFFVFLMFQIFPKCVQVKTVQFIFKITTKLKNSTSEILGPLLWAGNPS